jgi:ABC-type multidrug transport system fused ATPase/permease subunit
LLDAIDISSVGLFDLRSHITVVPQEPLLFAASLRENLDPFFKYSDRDIWLSLEKTYMKSWAMNLPLKLESHLMEGGANLSVGERQLLCMAKALLRKSRVLILDEGKNCDVLYLKTTYIKENI